MKPSGPNPPIEFERNPRRVRVRFNGQAVADSVRALTVREEGQAPVHYIPLADVDMKLLFRAPHATYCPQKGHAIYYGIHAGARHVSVAVWTYEEPHPEAEPLRGHLAFFADQDHIELDESE